MALQTRVDLFDNKGKKLKATQLSKASTFHLYLFEKGKPIRVTPSRVPFFSARDTVTFKKDLIDTYIIPFDKKYVPKAQAARREKVKPLTKNRNSKIVRKEGPVLGEIVLGYPPLDPPRAVTAAEKKTIRGQARLQLLEEFKIDTVESKEIIDAMFKAFKKNLPLIPKMLEEFMVVYYLQNKTDKKQQVKRLLAGKEVTANIEERPYLKGQLSQIDTILKLSLIKVEKEVLQIIDNNGEILRTLDRQEKAEKLKDGSVRVSKKGRRNRNYKNSDIYEELQTNDHLFAKVIATYRGIMEMSASDLGGGAWRDEVFDAVQTDILNVFQGFVDNGVFEYSDRAEYIIRIICPLFNSDRSVQEQLKTGTDTRYGLGISLSRTAFLDQEDVADHLLRPNTQALPTPELVKVSLFDSIKFRIGQYLKMNDLNTFAITGFTIERLIYN